MAMRRLFIIRKDLKLSAGKLAAMVAHCSEAYWTNWLKEHTAKVCVNCLPCVNPFKKERTMQWYRHGELHRLSEKAFNEGKDCFYYHSSNNAIIEDPGPIYKYQIINETTINNDVFENYINASFIKTICEAKNLNHLLKAVEKAKEMGMIENKDFGLINDICRTELTPENEDGTCTVGIWFKPLDDDIAHEISKKYQLYKD